MDIKTNGNGHNANGTNGNGTAKTAGKTEEFLPNSKKVYVTGKLFSDVKVPFREITLSPTRMHDGSLEENESLKVYDTSGPWGDGSEQFDPRVGLPALREKWIKDRGDVEEYEGITQRRELLPLKWNTSLYAKISGWMPLKTTP